MEDEIPFDIPDSWEWVRLGIISTYAETKEKINAQNADPSIWGLDLEDIEKGGRLLCKKTVSERKAIGDKTLFFRGDILYSKLRPYLLKILVADDNGICTPEIVPFKMYGGINPEYIVFYLQSPYVDNYINSITYGVKMPRVGTETMVSLLVPLPPLNEQNRIVNKIKEVIPTVTEYEKATIQIDNLNNSFPEQLKKSILQWAVQGKLVPQDENDEPAEVLLERIRTEKEALIKAGKIKRDKHESVIFRRDNSHYEKCGREEACIDDEIPFEIPTSWQWVRFSQIVSLENGDRSSKYPVEADYVSDGIPFFGAKDMGEKEMNFENVRFISEKKFKELGNGKLRDYDMICLLRGNVGKTRIFRSNERYHTGFICAQMLIIRCINTELIDYLYNVVSSPYYMQCVESKVTGTAVRQLPAQEIGKILIPIPPIKEQRRICKELSILSSITSTL